MPLSLASQITDVDDANMESATIMLTNHPDGPLESLSLNAAATAAVAAWNAAIPAARSTVTPYVAGTGVLLITGSATKAVYQSILDGVQYNNTDQTPDTADRIINATVFDGNDNSNTATATVHVVAVNDAPVNAVPAAQSVNEDTSLVFTGANAITISDVDVGAGAEQVTLSVSHGALTLSGTSGLGFTAGDGTADSTMTFTGTVANINAALNGLIYHGNSNFNGSDTLTITTNDQGNSGSGGAQSDTDTVALTVTAVNDAPTANITNTTFSATEQTNLTLANTGISLGSIADIDAGSGVVQATLSVTYGSLTVTAGNSGVTGITGSGTSSVTFNGTLTQINNLLGGVNLGGAEGTIVYNPNTDNPPATSTLTLLVHDNGNTGGGDLTGSDTATINITAVNDAPVVSGVTVNGSGQISFSIVDPDSTSFTLLNTPVGVAAAFGNPTLALGSNTLSAPSEQASALSGTLQISDGAGGTANVIGLYLGTSAGNTATAPLAGSPNAMYGFGGNDTLTGSTAADFLFGGANDDTINLATGHFVAGELIDGGSGTDTIAFTTTGDGTSVDFTVGTISNVETLTSVNQGSSSGYDQTFTLTATQWAALTTIDMNDGTDVLNVVASGDISSDVHLPTVTDVETGNLTGTAGDDSVTLTGAQLDAILIGSGTINLGGGTGDTINLTSTSADLNTLGAGSNSNIAGVETISAATASAGVTITLSGQSEAFTVTGSSHADTITGGSGADTITGGDGGDNLTGGGGSDTFVFTAITDFASGCR